MPGLGAAVLSVVAVDLVVKREVERWLAPTEHVAVWGDWIRLTPAYNTGAAFGLLSTDRAYVLLLSAFLIVGLVVWAVARVRQAERGDPVPLALAFLVGGAVANFSDRLLDGRVTDYLDVGVGAWRWPTFNLADGAIVLGVLLLAFFLRQQPPLRAGGS